MIIRRAVMCALSSLSSQEAVSAATEEERLVKIHNVIQQLPPPHYRSDLQLTAAPCRHKVEHICWCVCLYMIKGTLNTLSFSA